VRGWRFGVAHDGYRGGDVVEKMGQENERTLVTALVETTKGIDNADEILSVAGVDVGWVGHYDLTNTMGITAQFEQEEFQRAVGKLFGACERHGKASGFLRHPPRKRGYGAPKACVASAMARTCEPRRATRRDG
jgi:2-keto-3-deoxy-L-rhamnonate aldolase RhmA